MAFRLYPGSFQPVSRSFCGTRVMPRFDQELEHCPFHGVYLRARESVKNGDTRNKVHTGESLPPPGYLDHT